MKAAGRPSGNEPHSSSAREKNRRRPAAGSPRARRRRRSRPWPASSPAAAPRRTTELGAPRVVSKCSMLRRDRFGSFSAETNSFGLSSTRVEDASSN